MPKLQRNVTVDGVTYGPDYPENGEPPEGLGEHVHAPLDPHEALNHGQAPELDPVPGDGQRVGGQPTAHADWLDPETVVEPGGDNAGGSEPAEHPRRGRRGGAVTTEASPAGAPTSDDVEG